MSERAASPSNGRLRSRSSPSTRAASAALARPGPIAAATSAGVVPGETSRAVPSGSVILNWAVIVLVSLLLLVEKCAAYARSSRRGASGCLTHAEQSPFDGIKGAYHV